VLLVINSQQWTLTGRRATKAQVMKRMSSFGLIHIAAYGNQLAGENALSLNPGWDYMLKMSDVQGGNIQACLMVLNCFSKWTRQNLGVVGIACAFLAAGARSVLVTLWAIYEATMVFLKSFYQHMKHGKAASAAIHQSTKSFHEI